VESEGGDSASCGWVGEEFEVVQKSLAAAESTEDVGPACLLFVTVSEGDVGVSEGFARRVGVEGLIDVAG